MHSYQILVVQKTYEGFIPQAKATISNLIPPQWELTPHAHLSMAQVEALLASALAVLQGVKVIPDLSGTGGETSVSGTGEGVGQ